MAVSCERWWTVQSGPGPIVATAIHDGHDLRPEAAELIALPDSERLREEDPFTGQSVLDIPTHVVAHRSRFEFDLNRPPESAVYRTPDESWGLKVWKRELEESFVERSLAMHSDYYRMLGQLLDGVASRHQRFVLVDVHSYNHRRDGPDSDPTPQEKAPCEPPPCSAMLIFLVSSALPFFVMAFLSIWLLRTSLHPGIGAARLQRTYVAVQHISPDQGKNTNTVA